MTRQVLGDGSIKATCNHCKNVFTAGHNSGTNHLKRHLEKCAARVYHDITNYCISGSPTAQSESAMNGNQMTLTKATPNLDAIREALSVLLVACALPFSIVESSGFKYFMSIAVPQFNQLSRQTIQRDITSQYKENKLIVAQELQNAPGRICFTTDNWRSEHTIDEFMCVTAHWIDKNWKLQKRMIKFGALCPPLDGASLADEILLCLGDWKIIEKAFSFTVDNASYNDTMIASIKGHMLRKQSLVMHGEFFHMRCSCHIINLVVQAGLKVIDDVVLKIRKIVSHLKHSMPKQKKFYEIAATNFSLNTIKRIRLDTPTRWNSTYLMLDRFIYFRDAIESFVSKDVDLKVHRLTEEEWEKVSKLRKFLKHFYDVTNDFSASNTPTSNIYFRGVLRLHKLLTKITTGPPSILSSMVNAMEVKFEKYWDEYNLLLSCAAVLDPRLKLEGVNFLYERLFGEVYAKEMARKIRNTLIELLDEYKTKYGQCSNTSNADFVNNSTERRFECGSDSDLDCDDDDDDILLEHMNKRMRIEIKSELDLYLDEKTSNLKEDLNILQFWKRNGSRFPVLSAVARDLLCIPISTVPSESAFSLGKKMITSCRSSLSDTTIESLACYEDWLRARGFDPQGQTIFKIGDVSAGYTDDDDEATTSPSTVIN